MTTTTTAKQIRRYIGGTDMLVLAEVDGTMWASNRVWLTRAQHVQPFLDKHGIDGPGAYRPEPGGARTRLCQDDGTVSTDGLFPKLLDLADYTVPLKDATLGEFDAIHVTCDGHCCQLLTNSDGSRHLAMRIDWLNWLEDAPVPAAGSEVCSMRLATTERPNGPVAIIAGWAVDDGYTTNEEIAAVVMPILHRKPEDAPSEGGDDGPHLKAV